MHTFTQPQHEFLRWYNKSNVILLGNSNGNEILKSGGITPDKDPDYLFLKTLQEKPRLKSL